MKQESVLTQRLAEAQSNVRIIWTRDPVTNRLVPAKVKTAPSADASAAAPTGDTNHAG